MDNYVYIGKIVNTHGIRGEIRLLSNFSHKDRVFQSGQAIYIGRNKVKEVITGYRKHKMFDMITLDGYRNINEVLKYKGALCYVLRDDLHLAAVEYLESDLIGLPVFIDQKECGSVIRVETITEKNKVLWILIDDKELAIPFVDEFVEVQFLNKKVMIKPIEGLL